MNEYYPANVLTIPNATPETKDAAQYMYRIYKGNKVVNYNLCGEFCVAYVMQDDTGSNDIDVFLAHWQAESPNWYNSVFRNGLGRTTGKTDLKQMLDDYSAFYLDLTGLALDATAKMLEEYQLIIAVKIDYTGYLVSGGIPHWVVVERIEPSVGNSANVVVYNPFTNAMQPFGWREFNTSAGAGKYGLWVRRNKQNATI